MNGDIFKLIDEEKTRQETTINLIASENYASNNILKAAGSVLTNKYAEGYPGKRYYAGCATIDKIENISRDLGKLLFKAEHINVQPHSGSSANMAVYLSQLKNDDVVLGMSLSAGGHLTHGHKVNFSGKTYNFIPYGVSPENEQIDYDEIDLLANQHKPKLIVAGASSYSRAIDFKRLSDVAKSNNALLFIDMAHIAGLVATGLHQSPIPYADIVSSTTHKTLRGPRGGIILCKTELAKKIDRSVMPGAQGGPLMHIIAAKAIAFEEALQPEFKSYQEQVLKNAKAMSDEFKNLGYKIVTNGTDNHLFLINLTNKNVTGKDVEIATEKSGITLNRNMIPFDKLSPNITSGIRIGSPAITTRGFKENEVKQVVHFIDEIIQNKNNELFFSKIKTEVEKMCSRFPIY